MKKIIQHPALIITIVALSAMTVAFYAYLNFSKHPSYKYTEATVKDITESVTTTGQVKPSEDVSLAFERSGKVSSVHVTVGENVYAGQALVSLDAGDALADLSSAKAALALAKAQAGLQGTTISNAQASLVEAQKSLLDKIQNAYIASDDAVRTEASIFFANPSSENPKLILVVPNQQLSINIQDERQNLEQILVNWNNEISDLTPTSTPDFESLSAEARQNVLTVKNFLDDVATALNIAVNSPDISDAILANGKLTITTSRANISNVLVSLSGADSQLTSSDSAYKLALQQGQSGSSEISLSQAQIDSAQANVDKAQLALAKTVLRAPFSGLVSKMDAKVGQTVAVGVSLVNMISNSHYQIESYLSESDVAKINIGQDAAVTLDAYGNSVVFPAKVVLVDPASTIQNGVSSYKVTLEFVENDTRIKSGMTANVNISVASKSDILTIPASAVMRRGSDDYVLVLEASSTHDTVLKKITTGLVGNDGSIEVISGLASSDLVVSLAGSAMAK